MNPQRLSIPNKNAVPSRLIAEVLDQIDPEYDDLIAKVLRYKVFSRVQGHCLEAIFNNWDNILINAPTGSGKTHIFEVALLYHYLAYEYKDKFKCILIVPIKSLCSEVSTTWHRIFGPLKTLELNSDFIQDKDEELQHIVEANILIMTPEKFSNIMKRPAELDSILTHLRLIVVDEMHILDDMDRGPALESAITRLKMIQAMNTYKLAEKSIRLLCASATFNNGQEICKWLGVPKDNFLQFSEDFRPVQLTNYVFGYPNAQSAYHFDMTLNFKLNDIIGKFSYGKNCLIFCPTQKSAQKTAEDIIRNGEQRQFIKSELHLQELSRSCTAIKDQALKNCLISGVGFHSAGLDQQSRREVEKLFRENNLQVLCTTSTLAQGVNLPAYLVIVKGTKTYRGNTKGFEEYKYQDIIQMVGRAGRPQFDTSGVCVIMTDYEMVPHYEQIKNHNIEINSHYLKNIRDDIGAEIALGSVSTVDCAVTFVQKSFFFVRYTCGKQKLELLKTVSTENMPSNIGAFIRAYVQKCLDELVQLNLANKEGDLYTSTQALKEICKQCVAIDALEDVIRKPADILMTKESLLTMLSLSNEFSRITSKVNERKELNELNKFVSIQLKKSACTYDRKALVLVQAYIQRLKIVNWDLKLQANEIANTSTRILKCYFKIYIDKKSIHCVMLVYDMLLAVKRKVLNSDYMLVLKQITGIDDIIAKELITKHQIRSLSQLRITDPAIFSSLSKRPSNINSLLQCLPDLNLIARMSKKGQKTSIRIFIKELSPHCSCIHHLIYNLFLCTSSTVIMHRYINLRSLASRNPTSSSSHPQTLSTNPQPQTPSPPHIHSHHTSTRQSVDYFIAEAYVTSFPVRLILLSDFYVGCNYEIVITGNDVQNVTVCIDWLSQFKMMKTGATGGFGFSTNGGPAMTTRITEYFGNAAQKALPASERKEIALKKEEKKVKVAQNMLLTSIKKLDRQRSDLKTTAGRCMSTAPGTEIREKPSEEYLDFNQELEELVAEYNYEQKNSLKRSTQQLKAEICREIGNGYDIENRLLQKAKPKKQKLSKKPLPQESKKATTDYLLEALIKGRPDLEDSLRAPINALCSENQHIGKSFMLPIPKAAKSTCSFSRFNLNFD